MGTKISDLNSSSSPDRDSEIVVAHNGQNAKVKLSDLSDVVAPVQLGGGLSKNSEGGLKLSSDSSFILLIVKNGSGGRWNTQDMTYTPGEFNAGWNVADIKFHNLWHAMVFAQNNFSSGTLVKIVLETDVTETRVASTNHYDMRYFSCEISVVGNYYYGTYGILHQDAHNATNVGTRNTVTISGQNSEVNNMILWNGSGFLTFELIKFDIQDINHNGLCFGIFRSEGVGLNAFVGVKIKISGSSTYSIPRVFESRDGGSTTIRVAAGFGTGTTIADPLLQGFSLNAVELDFASYVGGFNTVLDVAAAGKMRILEYNGHLYAATASGWTFNANICFTTSVEIKLSIISIIQSSIFEANGPIFTKANGVTVYTTTAAIYPRQYASLSMPNTKDFGSNEAETTGSNQTAGIPGTNSLYHVDAVAIADYVQSGTFVYDSLLTATASIK